MTSFTVISSTGQFSVPPPSAQVMRFLTELLFTNTIFYANVRKLMEILRIEIPADLTKFSTENASNEISTVETIDEPVKDIWKPQFSTLTLNNFLESKLKSYKKSRNLKRTAKPLELSRFQKSFKFSINSLKLGDKPEMALDACHGDFGQFSASTSNCTADRHEPSPRPFDYASALTLEEIKKNRLKSKDMRKMKIFDKTRKNQCFEPSMRLYVKNIAKNTTETQLWRLFACFVPQADFGAQEAFDLRYMQKGRLRGQAFVVYDSVHCAKKAFREINGFVLNDKPLVVEFSRSNCLAA